ncbi:Hypothetical predicted protein [Olea europaea subsp. europaea]|uniref:Low temperature viability protein n=1 Tax=Olea europaea subsp. europaea TaxID=158383 RepID=A0A8S0VMM6_OLEEU|nr:Hypothetical predicted protein [Olea europaea subsp. europaea]
MGKTKKFFDKKKSATFQLMARDTSDPNYSSGPSGDRVFVRVDSNPYTPNTSLNEEEQTDDQSSIFADAPEDNDGEAGNSFNGGLCNYRDERTTVLPDHVRREILELGFPDDGYNYLLHMREIKNTGGGSSYYHNPKANLNQLPRDVKAYDASRVEVSRVNEDSNENSLYNVASRTVGARLQKVVDPEVAAMLDESDSSNFGSDVEDLEEDFIMRANFAEGPLDIQLDKRLSLEGESKVGHKGSDDLDAPGGPANEANLSGLDGEKPRARRLLDEQFDLLELQEYGNDSEEEYSGYIDEENECQESLAEKIGHAFKDRPIEGLAIKEAEDIESPEAAADVIRRCKEYGEKYENENPDQEAVIVEDSSDESEIWDCETIVSTYSNLDNHPAKIEAPGGRRKKKMVETTSGDQSAVRQLIVLKGREKLPVGFLPQREKHDAEKVIDKKDPNASRTEQQKRKPRGLETKEEKKERKSALKAERREARQMKKDMKGLYKSEGQRAQKVAAFTGPSSIHLM